MRSVSSYRSPNQSRISLMISLCWGNPAAWSMSTMPGSGPQVSEGDVLNCLSLFIGEYLLFAIVIGLSRYVELVNAIDLWFSGKMNLLLYFYCI